PHTRGRQHRHRCGARAPPAGNGVYPFRDRRNQEASPCLEAGALRRRNDPVGGSYPRERSERAVTAALKDGHGRTIEYLRISVTDRCNFRCLYCMPTAGLEWLPKAESVSYEEIAQIVREE